MLNASSWYEVYQKTFDEFRIDSPIELAAFLAQIGHESQGLTRLSENLNYSAKRLTEVWPNRFPTTEKAQFYANSPERLANLVYGGRYGNGLEASGDGWKYRGRGPKQITFAYNYRACGQALKLDLTKEPDLLLTPKIGARSSGWYWASRNCKESCANVLTTTKKINGGENGIKDRTSRFEKNKKILGVK